MCKNDVEKFIDDAEEAAQGAGDVGQDIIDLVTFKDLDTTFKAGPVRVGLDDIFKPVTDPIKDITGASATEEANKLAREQFEQSKKDAKEARKEGRARTARDQLSASRLAASARKTSTARSSASKASPKSSGSNLGSDIQDFLGL